MKNIKELYSHSTISDQCTLDKMEKEYQSLSDEGKKCFNAMYENGGR